MARTRDLLILLALGAASSVGCSKDKTPEGGGSPSASVSAAASPLSSGPSAAGTDGGAKDRGGEHARREGMRGGRTGMFFHAARSLDLKDEQKAKIEAAEKSAQGDHAAMRDAAKDLHADLVSGIKAGKIDAAKLEPRYAAIEKVMKAQHDKDADALNALFGILDPAQRKALVASIRTKMNEREEHAHPRADGADGGKPGWDPKHDLDRLTRDLDLDADQQKKVAALAPKDAPKHFDPAEMKKEGEEILAAFEKDTFDAKKLAAFDVKKMRAPMDEEVKRLAQLLPILKPEQREKLAAKMEKGPSPHGGHHGGFGHGPGEDGDDD